MSNYDDDDDDTTGWWKVINTPALYIFTGPSTTYDKIGEIPEGSILQEISNQGDWIQHAKGWSLSYDSAQDLDYLEVIDAPQQQQTVIIQQQKPIYVQQQIYQQPIYQQQQQQFYKQTTQKFGGHGQNGQYFDDNHNSPVIAVNIKHGIYVDAIQMIYQNGQGNFHGGQGGNYSSFNLRQGEKIVQVNYRCGGWIDAIQFVTNYGLASPWYGGNGGSNGSLFCGQGICNMKGTAAQYVDSLQFDHW